MKIIAVECPRCRLIEDVAAGCVLLEIGSEADEHGDSSASWICDTCRELVALPVDLTVFIDLVAAGASVLDSDPERRSAHPESAVGGPAFTHDDLLEFHQHLASDAWLAQEIRCEQQGCDNA